MAAATLNENTLRPTAGRLLVWAFVVSLTLHLLGYGGFELGHRMGWWKKDLMPSWLKSTKQRIAELQKLQPKQPPPVEPQLVFVEVDPSAAPVEAPKDAKNYSSRNSRAANIASTVDTQTPKFDGKQTHVPQARDSQPSKALPLQPTPPKPQPEVAKAESKPPATPPIGDLTMVKAPALLTANPDGSLSVSKPAPPEHVRPRRLSDVPSNQTVASEKMKQDGGLSARMNSDSFDAKATPFGEYDWKLVQAIRERWFALLDSKSFSRDRTGRVIVEFRLLSNGHITGMKVVNSEVDDLLTYVCQTAITDPAPYEPWPSDMRRFIGTDYRDVQFTFWYE